MIILHIIKWILCIGVALYILVCIFLFLYQESLLFFPQKTNPKKYEALLKNPEFEHLSIKTSDGNTLDGWKQRGDKKYSIIYFGGNADEVSHFVTQYSIKDSNIIAYNYRGYGESTGIPNEQNILKDALLIYDTLVRNSRIDPKHMYLMGRSLGTGVATYLASQRQSAGVILVTPYDSIESLAVERFPYFPISLLLRNKFPSTEYATLRQNPVLMIYGGRDDTISNIHTETLIQSWNGSIKKHFLPNADHNNILEDVAVWKNIEAFIQTIRTPNP